MDLKPTVLMSWVYLFFAVVVPIFIVLFFRLQRKKQDAANASMRRHLEQVCDTEAKAMSTVEVLKAAKAIIADERRWTRGAFARDKDGYIVPPQSPIATCWCAHGAIRKFKDGGRAIEYLDRVAPSFRYNSAEDVNDNTSHRVVLQMYDEAIVLAEAKR